MEAVHVTVDPDVCVGSATCTGMAPDHFEIEDGVAVPIVSPADLDDDLQDAVDSCPVQAILVRRVDA